MQPCPCDLVGDLHPRAESHQRIERPALGRAGVDARDHPNFRPVAHARLELGAEQPKPRVADERAQEIDPIRARDLARDLTCNLHVAPSVDEESRSSKR